MKRVAVALLVGIAACGSAEPTARDAAIPAEATGPYAVDRVVDGDTVRVDMPESVPVRLIGINTPETVDPRRPVECFGQEASDRAHELLDGEDIYLEQDPTQGETDRFGRALAYVWLPDGRLFNEEMIAEGYAYEYTYDLPYKYQARFDAAEAAARENERGLWAPGVCE